MIQCKDKIEETPVTRAIFLCLSLFLTLALPQGKAAWAADGGYEGVMAPAQPDTADKKDPDEGAGYEGVMAPATPSDRKTPAAAVVVPDSTEPAADQRPAARAPEMTAVPYSLPMTAPETADDLKLLSLLYAEDKDGDGVPDSLTEPRKVAAWEHQTRIDGKLPVVAAVEKNIERIMASLDDKTLSENERIKKAKDGYNELNALAGGLRHKQSVPNRIYQQMGLPDSYLKDKNQGLGIALSTLEKALAYLKKYPGGQQP